VLSIHSCTNFFPHGAELQDRSPALCLYLADKYSGNGEKDGSNLYRNDLAKTVLWHNQ
jgi:hypothetical protein